LQLGIIVETKNSFTLTKQEGVMFSKSSLIKAVLLLVLVFLVTSIVLGVPVLADGGGDQPYPPTENPSQGETGGSFLVVTLLTILELVL
jgi:hypothetical protein